MAILENIRKRTTVLILIIGLALFAFVISGIFTSNGFSEGKMGSSVGEVNGESISIDEFRSKLELASNRYGSQASSTQLVNSVWNQEVRSSILQQQFDKLGIDIGQDQIMSLIRNSPGYGQSPQFQDANGNFDEDLFRNFIADIRANEQQYQLWLQDEQAIIQSAKEQMYFNLIKAGVGATLKEGELDYHLASDKVDIKYVRVPYTSIPDSTIVIGKQEISDYISEHKDKFKQEPARDLQFVYFEEKPSEEDIAEIQGEIKALMEGSAEYNAELDSTVVSAGFRDTEDVEAFLDRNSDTKYDTIYRSKRELPAQFADTLMALEPGQTYGPYRDGDVFKVSRMMDKKKGGSVKASHILIMYAGAERANPDITRTKEEAEKRAEELLVEARKEETVFAELARDNSDGPSAPRGGDLGYFQEGIMTGKFNDFAFGNSVGTVGLVETEFGFHIVKIDAKEDVARIATLSREIEPSENTLNQLFTDATTLEMEATNGEKSFLAVAEEKGFQVRPVNKVKAMDENLPGLGAQRRVVQWAFNPETEIGDLRRFDINNGYAIVQLTAKFEEGIMDVEDASSQILPILRKERKAEQIIASNQGKSLDEIASANGVAVSNASALNVKSPTIAGAGREPLVVGTAVTMNQGEVSELLAGESGVFKFEVVQKTDAPAIDNFAPYSNALKNATAARVNSGVYNALMDKAEIEDNRSIFY